MYSDGLEWSAFALFSCTSILCAVHVLTGLTRRTRNRSARYGVESCWRLQRWTFRTWFQALLLLANTARAGCTLLELWLNSRFENNMASWESYLLRGIPSLFFFSTYSMIIIFWAQLIFLTTNHRIQLIRPAFGLFNIASYVVFIVVALVTRAGKRYDDFWQIDLIFNVGLYGVGLFVAGTYTYHILPRVMKSRRVVNKGSMEHRIINQIFRLLIVCVTVFAIRAFWSLGLAIALHNSEHFRPFAYDFIVLVLVEIVPTIVILALIHKRHDSQAHKDGPHGTPRSPPMSPSRIPMDEDLYRALPGSVSPRNLEATTSKEFLVFVPRRGSSVSDRD